MEGNPNVYLMDSHASNQDLYLLYNYIYLILVRATIQHNSVGSIWNPVERSEDSYQTIQLSRFLNKIKNIR